jgi:hypothetical protein
VRSLRIWMQPYAVDAMFTLVDKELENVKTCQYHCWKWQWAKQTLGQPFLSVLVNVEGLRTQKAEEASSRPTRGVVNEIQRVIYKEHESTATSYWSDKHYWSSLFNSWLEYHFQFAWTCLTTKFKPRSSSPYTNNSPLDRWVVTSLGQRQVNSIALTVWITIYLQCGTPYMWQAIIIYLIFQNKLHQENCPTP